MSLLTYEQQLTDEKCEIFGRLFQRSAILGYDSECFIQSLLTDKCYEDLICIDERQEWCDECFLMRCFENIKPFKKGDCQINDFELWFMGYLYKYWIRSKNMKPATVYEILPFYDFYSSFGFYHTQDWDYIIQDASSRRLMN